MTPPSWGWIDAVSVLTFVAGFLWAWLPGYLHVRACRRAFRQRFP